MKRVKFQQEASTDGQRPWSIIVDETGAVVYGRPDAEHLIGFGPKGEHEIVLLRAAFLENPETAVGLVPTFQMAGDMFSIDLVVESAEPYDADEDAVARLHERELQMRDVWANL